MKKISVLGSINMDSVINVKRIPIVGETVFGQRMDKFPGGKGANQSVAASRLGNVVTLIGCVGNDENGRFLLQLFDKEGLDIRYVHIDSTEPTGLALISVDQLGGNSIIVISGSNNAITDKQILAAKESILASDILVSQFEVPMEAVNKAFQIAKTGGVMTLLNPSPAIPISNELYTLTDVIIPNEHEIFILTGIPVTSPEDAYLAAQHLINHGVRLVIVTLGALGAVYKTSTFQGFVPASQVIAVDTTAAGDSFLGAICTKLNTKLMTEENIIESITFANKVAAIVVTRPGAQSSLPYLHELN